MSLSRITALALNITSPPTARIYKVDTGDAANAHASSTVQLVPLNGPNANNPLTANWVYSPSGSFTHYADFDTDSSGGYSTRLWEIRVRDISSDSFTIFNGGNTPNLATTVNLNEQRDILIASGAPAAPVLVLGAVGNTSVGFSWGAVSGALGYKLYRSTTTESVDFVQIGGTITDVSTLNTGLTPNTDYYYKLKANNGSGDSGDSNIIHIKTTNEAGSDTTTTPTITANSDGKVKRQQYEFRGTAEAGAKIQIQAGSNESFLTATADEDGNWQVNPAQWIPSTVTQIRVKAKHPDKLSSNWSSYVSCADAATTDKWGLPYQKAGLWYGFIVTFNGSPSSPTNVQRGAQISTTGHEDIADALQDIINWFDLH